MLRRLVRSSRLRGRLCCFFFLFAAATLLFGCGCAVVAAVADDAFLLPSQATPVSCSSVGGSSDGPSNCFVSIAILLVKVAADGLAGFDRVAD